MRATVRPIGPTLAAALLGLAATAPLPAQTCDADGALPRVCSIALAGQSSGEVWRELDLRRAIVVPTGGSLDLEVRAYDQWGSAFPRHRLRVGADLDWSCRDLVQIEPLDEPDRLRVVAGTRQGSCGVALWIPGNMSLEWRLTLEVAGRARTGYDLAEAEYVATRLYDGLLGRAPDPGGLRLHTDRIARGDLVGAIESITGSAEFRSILARESASRLLDQIYLGLLGRPVDSSGVRSFLPFAEAGRYTALVWEVVTSEEFEQRLAQSSR